MESSHMGKLNSHIFLKLCFVLKISEYFRSSICTCHHWNYEEFEDTKGATRIRKSKKNRQYNGKRKQTKGKNNDICKHLIETEMSTCEFVTLH